MIFSRFIVSGFSLAPVVVSWIHPDGTKYLQRGTSCLQKLSAEFATVSPAETGGIAKKTIREYDITSDRIAVQLIVGDYNRPDPTKDRMEISVVFLYHGYKLK